MHSGSAVLLYIYIYYFSRCACICNMKSNEQVVTIEGCFAVVNVIHVLMISLFLGKGSWVASLKILYEWNVKLG